MSEAEIQRGNGQSATAASPATGRVADPPPDRRPIYRRPAFIIFILVVLVLAVAAGAYYLYSRQFEETDDAYVDGNIVPINPQVSALVLAIHINDNQQVKKGDLLVELDPTDYKVALAQAQGAEASARGKLEQAQSAVPAAQSVVAQAQAELDAAQVDFDNANRDLQRYKGLDERAKSQQQLDNAVAAQKRAQADVEQAKAKLQSAQSQVITARANVTAAQGDLQKAQADTLKAQTNLGYCQIRAPQDGKITNRNVNPGIYVTPATQLCDVVPADVWVTANYKETQLNHMQVGQPVSIHVDAYPDRDLRGTINSIQAGTGSRFSIIPAENATGNFVKIVQRVPVKITFDGDANNDPRHLLSPGMSVETKVNITR